METDRPKLFVEINDKNFIFIACAHDENQNLKVIEKIITSSEGLDKNKFINIDLAKETIKRNVGIIEKILNILV